MKKLQQLDEFLVHCCQTMCDSIQQQTGFNNFSLCRCINLLLMILDCFFIHKTEQSWLRPGIYCIVLLIVFSFEKRNEMSGGKNGSDSKYANPALAALTTVRYFSYVCNFVELILILVVLVLLLVSTSTEPAELEKAVTKTIRMLNVTMLSISTTLFLVILSCTPLPPCSGKLWEKFDFFKKAAPQMN